MIPSPLKKESSLSSPSPTGADTKDRDSKLLKPIINRILASASVTQTLFELDQDLKNVFGADKVTIYALDRANMQLFSRNFKSEVMQEIRIEVSPKSLSGFVAASGKMLNIRDAYDDDELAKYHKDLTLDKTWDKKLNYRTKSMLVVPLPYQKKLMGVLQIINKVNDGVFDSNDLRLAKELAIPLGHSMVKMQAEIISEKVKAASHAIHSAETMDKLLLDFKGPLLELFEAQMVTIYAQDTKNKMLYSKIKTGNTIDVIRVPIGPQSIAGTAALKKKLINISDVKNKEELIEHHPDMTFDHSWDRVSGEDTKSMLVVPLIHQNNLLGVLQVINKAKGKAFSKEDEKTAKEISAALALAIFNQNQQRGQKNSKFKYLTDHDLVTQEELTNVIAKARKNSIDIETILLEELKVPRQELGKSLEQFYNVPYYGYSDSVLVPQYVFTGLNMNFLRKNLWLPLQRDEQKVTILIDDPEDDNKVQNIQSLFSKKKLEFKVGLKFDIQAFLNATPDHDEGALDQAGGEEVSNLLDALRGEADLGVETVEDDEEMNAISETDSTIVKLVNKFLIDAYTQGISDIHIEPGFGAKPAKVRFRKDGVCQVYQEIPPMYKHAILSRLKIMSKLDIAEKRLPQDGKIKMKYGKKEIEYRVATFPTVGGNEDAVIRILAGSKPIPLDEMKFSERNLALIKDQAAKPYGLILVVGPTGSGKTTTLHSTLGHINTPEKKIWTAEDPVEITQEGLRQIQVHPKIGLDFSRAMRAFLRGDPDVIMVGEMRDLETCAIGLEASLTGHLVFSTLHTNSAPETIARLLDMGMNPLNFSDALLLIVAQRLVRTLCEECKEDYHPTREEYDTLIRQYGDEDLFHQNIGAEYNEDLVLKGPKGCEKCGNTGYLGRIALHELLEGSPEMKRKIMKKAPVEELRGQAIADGMTTLKQDGIWKVFNGYCDLKQVLTVCVV